MCEKVRVPIVLVLFFFHDVGFRGTRFPTKSVHSAIISSHLISSHLISSHLISSISLIHYLRFVRFGTRRLASLAFVGSAEYWRKTAVNFVR